jgi:hypothetical protein
VAVTVGLMETAVPISTPSPDPAHAGHPALMGKADQTNAAQHRSATDSLEIAMSDQSMLLLSFATSL